MSDEIDHPLSLEEVAHALHVSTRTVERWIQKKHFPPPAHLPGGGKCWFRADIDAFLHLVQRGTFRPD